MSFTNSTFSTDQSSTSDCRDAGSFLVPRDPSITDPWMRPRPTHGTNLCSLFDSSAEAEDEHLKVYLRIKPNKKKIVKNCYEVKSDTKLLATQPDNRKIYGKSCKIQKLYNFAHIFSDANNSQEEIFDQVIRENLARFVEGHNFTILTYGASGSGKTYSLMGTEDEPGIIPRFLEALFQAVQVDRMPCFKPNDKNCLDPLKLVDKEKEIQHIQWILKNCNSGINMIPKYTLNTYSRMSFCIQNDSLSWSNYKKNDKKYEVWVSFAEIYNDAIFDLLRDDSSIPNQPPPKLRLIHSTEHPPYIKGLKWIYVRSGTEAFAALERGRSRLRYAQTNINSHSSRSHCLFSLKLVQYGEDTLEPTINVFRLCDLAGSERAKKTGNEGVRLNESRKINTSLHVLERCLANLRNRQDGQQSIPPYRESKLTSLLQNALSGLEAIAMLVTINPDFNFFDETQHVLQFSSIAKDIVGYSYQTMESMKKSKSCMDITSSRFDQGSDNSIDMNTSELNFLYAEMERIQEECENKIQQRERDVRMEITNKFQAMLKEKDDRFEETLEKQRNRLMEVNKWEIEQLKIQMTQDYDDMQIEYENEIAILKKNIKNNMEYKNAQTQTSSGNCLITDTTIIKEEKLNHSYIDSCKNVAIKIECDSSEDEIDVPKNIQSTTLSIDNYEISQENNDETVPENKNGIVPENNIEIVPENNIEIVPENNEILPENNEIVPENNNEIVRENNNEIVPENNDEIEQENYKEILPEIINNSEKIVSDVSHSEIEISPNNPKSIDNDVSSRVSINLPNNTINVSALSENIKNLSIIPDERIINSPLDKENLSPNKSKGSSEKENQFNKFYTEKKSKPTYLTELGALTVGNSRRKLFTRREFDEMAAETREPPKSTRCLNFEEDSPGAIHPPKLDKPYKMNLRRRKK